MQYQRCAVGGRIGADAVGLVLYVHYLGFRLNDKLRVQLSCAGNFDIRLLVDAETLGDRAHGVLGGPQHGERVSA